MAGPSAALDSVRYHGRTVYANVRAALLAALLVSSLVGAADSPLKVGELEVCEEVVDRVCQGSTRSFGPEVELVYFLTRVDGSTGEAFVTHVWTFEGNEVRRVKLPVRTSSYRTWSSKRVKGLPGKWRVEILDPVGRSLGVVDFAVEPPHGSP
jgi:hypothetical protein